MTINRISANYAVRPAPTGEAQARRTMQSPFAKRDSVTISAFGRNAFGQQNKAQSMVQSLMEQKQSITESKNTLVSKALEEGKGIDSIKNELKTYQEQLDAIDEQIAQTLFEEQKRAAEAAMGKVEPGKAEDNKPKTEEDLHAEKMKKIAALTGDLSQIKIVDSAKKTLQGRAKVLQSEIELDGPHALPSKFEMLRNVKSKITALSNSVAGQIEVANEKVGDLQKPVEVKPSPNDEKSGETAAAEPATLDTTA